MRPPTFGGTATALFLLAASLTPSLLPRHWLYQGVVSGIVGALGYAVGTTASAIARRVFRFDPPDHVERAAWVTLVVVTGVGLPLLLARAVTWQQHLHRLMGMPEPGAPGYVAAVLLGLVLATGLVAVARGVRHLSSALRHRLERWLPRRAAATGSVAVMAVLGIGLIDGLVTSVLFSVADETFRVSDGLVTDTAVRPVDAQRSGSPDSLVAWEDLGAQGRDFVAGGPDRGALEAFHDGAARDPIRVYVGLQAGEDDGDRAALVLDELVRTGAFDREVLCLMTTTGTGWIDPVAAAALEYLWAGDTALATMQYSYLPSWISFLVDQPRAREASAVLFDEVHAHWETLPEDDRPRLLVFGESLGADGSEAAFSGIADIRNRTDGVLWVGPPNVSELWRTFTDRRDPGTFERRPVYDGGATVRFAAAPEHLSDPSGVWYEPRVVYLQHPSDPVVWWSPRLVLRRPDWLQEPQGADVLPDMRWYPFVTFWQLTADLAMAERVPPGHGHKYGTLVVDAWLALTDPPGWTDADTARLKSRLRAELAEDT